MKKIIALVLSALLLIGAAVVGTVAFLTDTDQAVNVMTSGNIDIEQHEVQRQGDKLVPFVNSGLWPAFTVDGTAWEFESTVLEGLGSFNMYKSNVKNVKDKIVYVENTGKNAAYVRTVFAFENTDGLASKVVKNWANSANVSAPIETEIDGVPFVMYVYSHDMIEAGKSSAALLQIAFKEDVTNEMLANIGGNYKILSFTQAVQTEGFADATQALNRVFGEVSEKVNPWNDVKLSFVKTTTELTEAINEGGTVVLTSDLVLNKQLTVAKGVETVLDLGGHTLSGAFENKGSSAVIYNQGTLTITNGTVVSLAEYPDVDWGTEGFPTYATNTITNRGTLIIEDGAVIENQTNVGGASYAIDNQYSWNGVPSVLTVNGGTITAQDVAIRLCASTKDYDNSVTINGGTITGKRAVWIHLTGSDSTTAPIANLTVNGGVLTGTSGLAIYSYSFGNSFSQTTVALNGGTYKGDVAFGGGYKGDTETVTLNKDNCWFLGGVYRWVTSDTTEDLAVSNAVSDATDLADKLAAGGNVILTDNVSMESATVAPYGNKYAVKMDGGVLDGNGNELYMECNGDDYGVMISGGTVKNLTITEACRAIMIMYPQSDIILDNVKIGGDGVLYPINTGEGGTEGVNLIVTNSTLAGWTSFNLIESASFTNVKFEQGTYYNNIYGRVLKPYVNTTLTDCSFVEHMNLDLSSLVAGHKIIMKNCTVNGQAVIADVLTIPTTDAQYDTELFTVDLPSWATSINDCIIFE